MRHVTAQDKNFRNTLCCAVLAKLKDDGKMFTARSVLSDETSSICPRMLTDIM
jgi:hypothetical protein